MVYAGSEDDKEAAKALLENIEFLYQTDKDFRSMVDTLIERHGSLHATSDSLSEYGAWGWGQVGSHGQDGRVANQIVVDSAHLKSGDLANIRDTIAHEFAHNLGHNHGDEMQNFIDSTIDQN